MYFWSVLNIMASYFLLISLYQRIYAGKFIIKTKRKKISLFYTTMLVLASCSVIISFLYYLEGRYKDNYITYNLQGIFWIQMGITYFLGRLSLGIAKGGIYSDVNSKFSHFTKWDKIKSYKWISDNVIRFETLMGKDSISNIELEVNSEQKEEVDKFLKEKLLK